MRTRCENRKGRDYANYGGRGITICERWRQFETFLADMGECPPGKSIERRDNDGNYAHSNCYWATAVEQANNKRRTTFVTYCGERLPVATLAARFKMPGNVVYERIVKYGWSVEDAIKTPVVSRTANLTFKYRGKTYKLTDLAKLAKVDKPTLYYRLKNPSTWTVAEAVETPIIPHKEHWVRLQRKQR